MKLGLRNLLAAAAVAVLACAPPVIPPAGRTPNPLPHVFVIVMENQSPSQDGMTFCPPIVSRAPAFRGPAIYLVG